MKLIKSVIVMLVCTYTFGTFEFVAYASNSLSIKELESQITPESSSEKIIKLQNLFLGLGLYNGEIDGNYKSIEKSLLDYQIKSGIIINAQDYGAGYFGKKTITQLKKDFGDNFVELAKEHLILKKPEYGERIFIVTAYYSPLPGQNKYIRGSYEADVKLNGEGKTTASGKGVFAGLLAAPKNYNFGTKIKLEGIGIGSVEDRGGAIVNAGEKGHEYDRIDIWMGYGDDGLNRAIKWGTREVKGEILKDDLDISVEFDVSPVTKYNDLTIDAENPTFENVIKLQNLMTEVGLYNKEIDGKFENIKNELIDFQLKNGIIESIYSNEAGYFGEKTLAVMRKNYGGGIFKIQEKTNILISLQKKQQLEKIKLILLNHIEKKSKGNKILENKYRISLKNTIEKYIVKVTSKQKQQELRFLKDIL